MALAGQGFLFDRGRAWHGYYLSLLTEVAGMPPSWIAECAGQSLPRGKIFPRPIMCLSAALSTGGFEPLELFRPRFSRHQQVLGLIEYQGRRTLRGMPQSLSEGSFWALALSGIVSLVRGGADPAGPFSAADGHAGAGRTSPSAREATKCNRADRLRDLPRPGPLQAQGTENGRPGPT